MSRNWKIFKAIQSALERRNAYRYTRGEMQIPIEPQVTQITQKRNDYELETRTVFCLCLAIRR